VLQTGVLQIQTFRAQQELDKTGIAMGKGELRGNLVGLAMDIVRKGVAYARFANNMVLLQEMGYAESDLKKAPDTVLKDICQVIYDRATANTTALVTYNVTAVMLTNLKQAIDLYNASIPKPKSGIIEKKKATDGLVVLFGTIDGALGKLDSLVEMVRTTQVAFYKGY